MSQSVNQSECSCDCEEIDLREIIRTLGKWKYTIIAITLVSMFISGIVSLFFLDPVYEAVAMVAPASVSRIGNPGNTAFIVTDDNYESFTDSKKMSDNLDNLIKLTQVDVSRYKVTLTSNFILQNTIEELDLDVAPAELKGQIQVEAIKDMGDVSEVTVSNTDPELASKIANTLVSQTASYLNNVNTEKMNDLLQSLESQQAVAQDGLNISFANLKEFQAANGSVSGSLENEIELNKLQNEVDRREDVVNSLSSKILELKVLQSFDSIEDKVVVLSAAVEPESPVKPNKTLNVAIAGVLGLMLSVFGVFLYEYLKEPEHAQ